LDPLDLWLPTSRTGFNGTSDVENTFSGKRRPKEVTALSILWIILIIVLVLALLGFFSRGRW